MITKTKPNVLIIAGHDPSGGAGVHADIEAISRLECHAASIITCLTLQDTHNAKAVWPIDDSKIKQQLSLLVNDMSFDAIKLGLLGTPEIAEMIAKFIKDELRDLPLVVDPVLVASGGGELALQSIKSTYLDKLFPLASVVTPNAYERRALTRSEDSSKQIEEFMKTGMQSALLKGGDEDTIDVINTLYLSDGTSKELTWTRFEGEFHGSGCTLASAIAANLAKGQSIIDAVTQAQRFTWTAIKEAYQPGSGQKVPNRQFSI